MDKVKTVWESKGKSPVNGEPFMTVKEARGYYLYAQRAGTDSIAFILIDNDKQTFGLISESKPPMDEFRGEKTMGISAFGGSCDVDMEMNELCQKEVQEESGYNVELNDIVFVGKTMVSTQMNQTCHCFLVDVTGKTPGDTESDIFNKEQEAKDSDEFKHNKVVWLDIYGVMDNEEWKSVYIMTKFMYKLDSDSNL